MLNLLYYFDTNSPIYLQVYLIFRIRINLKDFVHIGVLMYYSSPNVFIIKSTYKYVPV